MPICNACIKTKSYNCNGIYYSTPDMLIALEKAFTKNPEIGGDFKSARKQKINDSGYGTESAQKNPWLEKKLTSGAKSKVPISSRARAKGSKLNYSNTDYLGDEYSSEIDVVLKKMHFDFP